MDEWFPFVQRMMEQQAKDSLAQQSPPGAESPPAVPPVLDFERSWRPLGLWQPRVRP